jgi:hypothetical protein
MKKFIAELTKLKAVLTQENIDINLVEHYSNSLYDCYGDEEITKNLIELLNCQAPYQKAIALVDKFLNENDQSDLIYHYCSVDSFFKIIESKSIWLSDSDYMNDSYEGKWVDKLVENALSRIGKQDKISEFKKNYNNEKAKKYYLFCLSKNGDQLSQWRGYADDGKGVAIGFSRKSLNLPEAIEFPIGIIDLIYDEKEQVRNINTAIEQLSNIKADINLLKNFSIWFKNSSFMEENETRIVHTPKNNLDALELPDRSKEYLKIISKNISKLQFRVSNSDLIPYVSYGFKCRFHSSLIPSIILGPKCILKENDLTVFLKSNGLENTIISASKSSYR